ncbi:MAG: hypothetical protein KGL39_29740 [Patescibacteria group bacterium]|nr:hypothetical protein [Patescibacteria group bacterium]
MSFFDPIALAATGTTGNVTGNSVQVSDAFDAIAFQFVVEVAGATPTVTYQFQGSVDGVNWYNVGYVTDATDGISQSTRTRTSPGADVMFLSNPIARRYRYFRVVTTANTNITFRAEMYVEG